VAAGALVVEEALKWAAAVAEASEQVVVANTTSKTSCGRCIGFGGYRSLANTRGRAVYDLVLDTVNFRI
jgi:hypothetical protein